MSYFENDSSPTSNKRRRLDEKDIPEWTRHPTLYMADGTIALLAGNTVFRVYTGLLCKHSEVFSDMFSLSSHQPSDAEMYDGCPLVRVADDAEDMGYFLNVLLDFSFFPGANETAPYRLVAGTLRLATKYLVQSLRKMGIDYFSRAYTTNFDTYIGFRDVEPLVFGSPGSPQKAPHPFEVVSLFHECRVEKFLPHAYLNACGKGFKALIGAHITEEEVPRLSPDALQRALLGWKSIGEVITSSLCTPSFPPPKDCLGGWCDDYNIFTLKLSTIKTVTHMDSRSLFTPQTLLVPGIVDKHVCSRCVHRMEGEYMDNIRKKWKTVPRRFGLRNWEELEAT